jgi:hypothetical protein
MRDSLGATCQCCCYQALAGDVDDGRLTGVFLRMDRGALV